MLIQIDFVHSNMNRNVTTKIFTEEELFRNNFFSILDSRATGRTWKQKWIWWCQYCYLRACQHWKVVSIISALQNLPSLTSKVEFLLLNSEELYSVLTQALVKTKPKQKKHLQILNWRNSETFMYWNDIPFKRILYSDFFYSFFPTYKTPKLDL